MKTLFLPLITFLIISVSVCAQEKTKKEEKHTRIVKMDTDGKKTELDTLITNGIFVGNGDTIGVKKGMKFNPGTKMKTDSIQKMVEHRFEYEISDDGNNNIVIFKNGKRMNPSFNPFPDEKDTVSSHSDRLIIVDGFPRYFVDKKHFIYPAMPGLGEVPPMPFPELHKAIKVKSPKNKNIIDLSDPGIISYKKKKLKGGREKIILIRNEMNEDKVRVINAEDKVIRIMENKRDGGTEMKVEVETNDPKK